jgi:hypothetical protein
MTWNHEKHTNEAEEVTPGVTRVLFSRDIRGLIDSRDWVLLSKYRWSAVKRSGTFYATAWIDGAHQYMHRILTEAPRDMVVDHINWNGLDNRRENLRLVTTRQNLQNLRRKKSSRFPGVYRDRGKWIARVCIKGEKIRLGRFDDETEAATAYAKHLESSGERLLTINPNSCTNCT